MRLLTDEIRQQFRKYPLYSQESKGINSTVIVKYFNPVGSGTWLITEAEEQEDSVAVIRILPYFLLGMGLYFLKRITGVKAAVRFNC